MDDEQLKKCTIETPILSLYGINTNAKVVNIIDGDTVVLIIPFLNKYFKFPDSLSILKLLLSFCKNNKVPSSSSVTLKVPTIESKEFERKERFSK